MNPQAPVELSTDTLRRPAALTVEGWRGINHSFALVNQFQLLEMVREPGLSLRHRDAPFQFAHWSKSQTGAGFHAADEAALTAIEAPSDTPSAAATYRIHAPINLAPAPGDRPLVVFAVTELGLDSGSFSGNGHLADFEAAGGLIATPSQWSRARILEYGFRPETVRVVPHAASPRYFFPLPAELRQAQRRALGFADHEVVFLNIGVAIWNKGIDVLLQAFARARQTRKDLRLLFKDQRNTYGMAGDQYVQRTLMEAGLWSDDLVSAITLIPANLTMEQMNSLYGVADCYVSPYRAEGFNLPVCEAMACGTPVIVTEGGATDDFVKGPSHHRLRSTLHEHQTVHGRLVNAYREPDADHLVELLRQVQPRQPSDRAALPANTGWTDPVHQLLHLLAY